MISLSLSATCALALIGRAFAAPSPAAENSPITPRQAPFQSTPLGTFNEPWALAFLPDGRILVTEKRGTLRLFDPATSASGEVSGVPAVQYGGQGGFGDVAIHPQFAENNNIYISYAEGEGMNAGAALARATLVENANGGGALQDVEVIWRQTPKVTGGNHFGHRILFDTNGTLWLSSSERDKQQPAQEMNTNLGKILRLNDDGTPAADNPFADQGDVAAQIWALGNRNVLGIDFDAEGRLWEIEMGPMGGDEFNLIERGANYGWPLVSQGNHYTGQQIPNHDTRPEFNPPKVFWNPVISPSSMIIYKGDMFPAFQGNAIISGLGAQGLVRVEINGDTAREAQRYPLGRRIRAVKEGPDGALYVLEDGPGGRLLRLAA